MKEHTIHLYSGVAKDSFEKFGVGDAWCPKFSTRKLGAVDLEFLREHKYVEECDKVEQADNSIIENFPLTLSAIFALGRPYSSILTIAREIFTPF